MTQLQVGNETINILESFTYKTEQKVKTRFHASDYGKPILDLYLKFKGVPETNPVTWNQELRFGAGRGVETSALAILKQNGIVDKDYNQEEDGGFKMERGGIEISGYRDAIHVNGCPIEIKSINTKNSYDVIKYKNNNPRENYVGQLAIYMDYMERDIGYLFVISMDGLDTFWMECRKIGERQYQCGNVVVDLNKEYKKWARLYTEYVMKDIEPPVNQYVYKKDIDTIDWSTVSDGDISKARNGHKVIGSWEVLYSPYKDLIVQKQGSSLGYTLDELEKIRELTKGYSTRSKVKENKI